MDNNSELKYIITAQKSNHTQIADLYMLLIWIMIFLLIFMDISQINQLYYIQFSFENI